MFNIKSIQKEIFSYKYYTLDRPKKNRVSYLKQDRMKIRLGQLQIALVENNFSKVIVLIYSNFYYRQKKVFLFEDSFQFSEKNVTF